jgi:16S rRNA (uracil1498-N3)-methyltransferase
MAAALRGACILPAMQEPWFYCPNLQCGAIVLDDAEMRHALHSRRLRAGDTLTLFDGAGRVGQARILPGIGATGERGSTDLRRAARRPPAALAVDAIDEIPPSGRTLSLIVPACKGPRLDWLVEKCTELGATRLVLAEFERSVVHAGAQHVEKLRRTAIEACKQSRRAWLPQIETATGLPAASARGPNAALLIAHLEEGAPSLAEWLARHGPEAHELAVVIGPEGGLAPAEIEVLRAAGAQVVRLAEHVLRIETAAIAVAGNWASHVLA